MTSEDARLIARIVGTAHSGCGVCVGELVELLNAAFPQFKWTETAGRVRMWKDTWEPVAEGEWWDPRTIAVVKVLVEPVRHVKKVEP